MCTAPVPVPSSTTIVSSLPRTTLEVLSKNGCLQRTPSKSTPLRVFTVSYSSIPASFITLSTKAVAIIKFP